MVDAKASSIKTRMHAEIHEVVAGTLNRVAPPTRMSGSSFTPRDWCRRMSRLRISCYEKAKQQNNAEFGCRRLESKEASASFLKKRSKKLLNAHARLKGRTAEVQQGATNPTPAYWPLACCRNGACHITGPGANLPHPAGQMALRPGRRRHHGSDHPRRPTIPARSRHAHATHLRARRRRQRRPHRNVQRSPPDGYTIMTDSSAQPRPRPGGRQSQPSMSPKWSRSTPGASKAGRSAPKKTAQNQDPQRPRRTIPPTPDRRRQLSAAAAPPTCNCCCSSQVTGMQLNIVHFSGSAQAYPQVIGGNIDIACTGPGSASRVGRQPPIPLPSSATTNPRSPTCTSAKSQGYDVPSVDQIWYAMTAPKVPEERLVRLESLFADHLQTTRLRRGPGQSRHPQRRHAAHARKLQTGRRRNRSRHWPRNTPRNSPPDEPRPTDRRTGEEPCWSHSPRCPARSPN